MHPESSAPAGPPRGSEPVYGAGYTSTPSAESSAARDEDDAVSPPYTAPYPPYPSDVSAPGTISDDVASGLAYFIVPAVFFLLQEPYRSSARVRFHCWQAIFFLIAVSAIRVIEQAIFAMLPSLLAGAISGIVSLVVFVLWLIAIIRAFQGSRWKIPVIGDFAERTAATGRLG